MESSKIDMIVVHGADTRPGMDIGFTAIDQWHKARGWRMCGYHWIIRRDGTIEEGRKENEQGAHARMVNGHSLGICLVGGQNEAGKIDCNYSFAQYDALHGLITNMIGRHPTIKAVVSHRDVDRRGKTCPNFDASAFYPMPDWEDDQ